MLLLLRLRPPPPPRRKGRTLLHVDAVSRLHSAIHSVACRALGKEPMIPGRAEEPRRFIAYNRRQTESSSTNGIRPAAVSLSTWRAPSVGIGRETAEDIEGKSN